MRDNFYRIIFYWNSFSTDEGRFSDSSTKFDVIGKVYNEIPSDEEMVRVAIDEDFIEKNQKCEFVDVENRSEYGLMVVRNAKLFIKSFHGKDKQVFLGIIQVPRQKSIKPLDGPEVKVTPEILSEAANYQDFGISDIGCDIDGNPVLVMEGWEFYPLWKLYGYNEESIEEDTGVEILGFNDENFRCDGCGAIMSTTMNTFSSNQKFIEENLEMIGVQCGCFKDYCVENVGEFINNTERAIDKSALKQLVNDGKAVHYSDLCYGWTCGMDNPADAINELYELAGRGGLDLAEEDEEDSSEGVLFQVDCVTPFNTGFSMWVYRNRQNTEEDMLKYLQEAYEDTTWLSEGDTLAVVNSSNPDTKELFMENYPDTPIDNTMYALVILLKDGGINTDFVLSEPKGSAYNALRSEMIDMDIWEDHHNKKA